MEFHFIQIFVVLPNIKAFSCEREMKLFLRPACTILRNLDGEIGFLSKKSLTLHGSVVHQCYKVGFHVLRMA